MDYLRIRLCKRIHPENWTTWATLTVTDRIAQVEQAEDVEHIPVARPDFSLPGMRDGFDALLKLRRDQSGRELSFALFDFAVLTRISTSRAN